MIDFRKIAAVGVLVAGVTGVASWLFGSAFLTSAYGYWTLPILGNVMVVAEADSLTLTATDMEVELVTEVAAEVKSSGSTLFCSQGI